jgi:hypothetical protein
VPPERSDPAIEIIYNNEEEVLGHQKPNC